MNSLNVLTEFVYSR